MSANNTNPLSLVQVEADLFMAETAMNKADSLCEPNVALEGFAGILVLLRKIFAHFYSMESQGIIPVSSSDFQD